MNYIVVCFMLAAANRAAGAGADRMFGFRHDKELFGLALVFSCGFLGHPVEVCLAVGILGYIARQSIGHGAVYRVEVGARHGAPWWSISFARSAMILAPLAAPPLVFLLGAAASAFGCLYVNVLCRRLEDRGMIGRIGEKLPKWAGLDNDMLKLAEPLQGLCYALALIGITVFGR